MKRSLSSAFWFLGFILCCLPVLRGQNTWINYSQVHYKFAVVKTGLHRITGQTLQNAGINLSSLDPRQLRIYARGQEIPLYIPGEWDGVLSPAEYIEFFAERNSGKEDAALYASPTEQAHPSRSLFTDTVYYFLTWNASPGALRFATEVDTAAFQYPVIPYYDRSISWAPGVGGSTYHNGTVYGGGSLNPEMEPGEGFAVMYSGSASYAPAWGSAPLTGLQSALFNAPATLEIRAVTGSNPNSATPDHIHELRTGNTVLESRTLDGYGQTLYSATLPFSTMSASSAPFTLQFLNTLSSNTRNGITEWTLNLKLKTSFGNRLEEELSIPGQGASKSALLIQAFNAAGGEVRLYDLTRRRRISVQAAGTGKYRAVIPQNNQQVRLYLAAISTVTNVAAVRPAGKSGYFTNYESGQANADYVVISAPPLLEAAAKYSQFRSLTGYTSLLVDVNELCEQYASGVPKHPGAIRNFLRMTEARWTLKPEHVFLIGKGIRYLSTRNNALNYNKSIMPPIGEPPCDNLYTFDVLGDRTQRMAIGRLAAETPQDVEAYLEKMQSHESQPNALWRKQFLHLGGGISSTEQQTLGYYLNNYKKHAQDSLMGGQVVTFLKTTSAPIQITLADSIRNLVDRDGVSVITVFGHGSGDGFDQNIDEPQNYNNKDRYFFLIGNSCYSGDIFSEYRLVSERFVMQPQKAAVGFLAFGSPGLSSIMNVYTDSLYRQFSRTSFGSTIGTCIARTVTGNAISGINPLIRFTSLGIQLHGDPAFGLKVPLRTDLVIRESELVFPDTDWSTDEDSLYLRVPVSNVGRMPSDSILVTVRWTRLGLLNADTVISARMPAVGFRDTIDFWLPMRSGILPGQHNLAITVDPANLISEVTKTNNRVELRRTVVSADINPIFPPKFAVVPGLPQPLSAQTGDPFSSARTYRMEWDTVPDFSSPLRTDTTFTGVGGVYTWTPQVSLPDSTVCFWRAGVDSANTGIFHKWRSSSYQVIQGKYGWGQARGVQHRQNAQLYLEPRTGVSGFDFVPVYKKLDCEVLTCPASWQFGETQFTIDGALMEENGCFPTAGIYVAVIDPITLKPWETRFGNQNPQNYFGNVNDAGGCRQRPEKYFIYWLNNQTQRDGLTALLNAVPNDYYILAYTFYQGPFTNPSFWPNTLLTAFENLGADTLRDLVTNGQARPYIFFTRKGDLSSTKEVVGASQCGYIQLLTDLSSNWIYGALTTSLIGPSTHWNSLTWQSRPEETAPITDTASLRVYGITPSGSEVLLIEGLQPGQQILNGLNDSIPAASYPFLKLQMFTRDDVNQTPRQLNQWHVLFDGVPELALAPNLGFSFDSDSVQQGDSLSARVTYKNIGLLPTDSLTIQHSFFSGNQLKQQAYHRQPPVQPGQLTQDTVRVSSLSMSENGRYVVDANQPGMPGHFRELTYYNNMGQRSFYVQRDRINPLLDVTFDGRRIMDGDLVSAQPLIQIFLKDENPLLPLNDTADWQLFLVKPGSATPQKIPFSSSEIVYFPAEMPENEARIEYRPELGQTDGMYELLVRANDRSGNASGKGDGNFDYRVRFEVVHQSSITRVLNYPNPFSTSTRFVFTLTGMEIPEELTIRIFNVAGVVVREITRNELGPIRIGQNITEFAWDGTDEFGDKLATGVYIFRVYAKQQGEELEIRNSGADRFFREGFGKMYLMR
jgi:hypothetical protein